MRVIRFSGLLSLMCFMASAAASDLGSAGPFRSIGGESCLNAANPCVLPAVDQTLPTMERSKAYMARATLLIDALKMDDVRDALNQAILADPSNADAYALRGRLALFNMDASARSDIDHALLLKPDDPDLLATWAYAHRETEELRQSIEAVTKSLRLKPQSADALWIRAVLRMEQNQYEMAFADLSAALTLNDSDLRARLTRTEVALALKQYDLAAFDSSTILKTMPSNIDALLDHAKALARAGENENAVQDLTTFLKDRGGKNALFVPQFREAALDRVRLLSKLGRADEAKTALWEILANGGKPAVLRLQLYLRASGFPNTEITGIRSTEMETALAACVVDKTCDAGLKL